MGAVTYITSNTGISVEVAMNELVNIARREYGNNSDNGTISTTSLGANITNSIPKDILKNKDKLKAFFVDQANDELLFPRKWESNYIQSEPICYKAYKPTWTADKQTPKRKNGVKNVSMYSIGDRYTKYNSIGEAKKAAKELTLATRERVEVYQHRSNSEQFQLGYMELETDDKEYKSTRKAQGKIYLPVYEFIFFVYANE